MHIERSGCFQTFCSGCFWLAELLTRLIAEGWILSFAPSPVQILWMERKKRKQDKLSPQSQFEPLKRGWNDFNRQQERKSNYSGDETSNFPLFGIFNQKNSGRWWGFFPSFPSLPPSLCSTDQPTLWSKGNKSSSFHLLLLMNDQLFVISFREKRWSAETPTPPLMDCILKLLLQV